MAWTSQNVMVHVCYMLAVKNILHMSLLHVNKSTVATGQFKFDTHFGLLANVCRFYSSHSSKLIMLFAYSTIAVSLTSDRIWPSQFNNRILYESPYESLYEFLVRTYLLCSYNKKCNKYSHCSQLKYKQLE